MKILLGPAGSPAKSTLEGVYAVKRLGLQAMEVQFSHGIKMSMQLAAQVGEAAQQQKIALSVHAPYFINLLSEEKRKIQESKKRILDSCERGHFLGASHIVFHPAYFGKLGKEEAHRMVKKEMDEMLAAIKNNSWNVQLAPETTGKHSAFGSLDETIRLAKELRCSLCVDPAHLYARGNGHVDWKEMFDKLETLKLKKWHFHFSGINYSAKGELNHVVLDGKPDFLAFAKELMHRGVDSTVISESPITWKDSLKMKRILKKLGYRF